MNNVKKSTFLAGLILVLGFTATAQFEPIAIPDFIPFSVCCVNGDTIFAGGCHGKVAKTVDGGDTWELLSTELSDIYHLQEISFLNSNYGFASSGYIFGPINMPTNPPHILIKTVDGGDTWMVMDTARAFKKIKIIDENTIYALCIDAYNSGSLVKSVDGGTHWNTLITSEESTTGLYEGNIYDFDVVGQHVFVLSSARIVSVDNTITSITVYGSSDGGATWSELADYSSPADGKLPARYTPARLIVANDEHSGQIIGHNMFSTEDGFQTFAMDPMPWSINPTVYYCWEHMGVKYLPSGWGCIFGNAFDGYDIAGFYRNLLITRDGGKHWMNITNQDIFDELFRCGNVFDVDGAEDSTFFIAAGQYGNARILRCRGGFPINIGVEAYDDADYTVYPNPTNGKLRIENGELTIEGVEVYDVYGKLLQTVAVNDVAADLDVSGLPAGLYFARIRTGNGVVTKRFVKR